MRASFGELRTILQPEAAVLRIARDELTVCCGSLARATKLDVAGRELFLEVEIESMRDAIDFEDARLLMRNVISPISDRVRVSSPDYSARA